MNTLNALAEADETDKITVSNFGKTHEEAIISLSLDHPDFFGAVSDFIKPEMFSKLEARLVIAEILNLFEKYDVIPTRAILHDHFESILTVDDPHPEIFRLVDRKSDYREVPLVKDTLLKWARKKAFGQLYNPEAITAYKEGNYEYLEEVFNQANRIVDVGDNTGFWFFENLELLFQSNAIEHRTTGFPRLDKLLNNGGPSPKEVVCWMAPTNVGKSILLCNNAMTSLKGIGPNGKPGQDVLLVTFELDSIKTAMRCLASSVSIPIDQICDHQDMVRRSVKLMESTYGKKLYIHELPPDECSVKHIYALLANLKRMKGWKPDVVILDYLDLMVSRHKAYNKTDYDRQKHVSTEIRGLAKNEKVLLFTATQTNRSGMDGGLIDLNKSADSFGKQFALDYVISLNQGTEERKADPAQLRLFIAKNRNGPKHQTITCEIDYRTMVVNESENQPSYNEDDDGFDGNDKKQQKGRK